MWGKVGKTSGGAIAQLGAASWGQGAEGANAMKTEAYRDTEYMWIA